MSGPPNMAKTVARFSYPRVVWTYADAPTVNDQGDQLPAVPTSRPVRMHVSPAPGAVVQALPVGQQGSRAVVVYANEELAIADPSTRTRGAVVDHDGDSFEIIARGAWTHGPAGAVTWRSYTAIRVVGRSFP